MAYTKTNVAEVYIGTNELAGVKDAKFLPSERPEIIVDVLGADEPTVLGVVSKTGPHKVEVTVYVDKADTNGQVALDAAYSAGTSVTLNYYPDGNTAGNEKHSGTAYVTKVPDSGGQGKNQAKEGTYILVYTETPTKTTVGA